MTLSKQQKLRMGGGADTSHSIIGGHGKINTASDEFGTELIESHDYQDLQKVRNIEVAEISNVEALKQIENELIQSLAKQSQTTRINSNRGGKLGKGRILA